MAEKAFKLRPDIVFAINGVCEAVRPLPIMNVVILEFDQECVLLCVA